MYICIYHIQLVTRARLILEVSNFDSELFKCHLDMAPWHIIQLFDEVDDQVHAWNLIMNDVLNDLAPVKKMRVRDKDVLYMTPE